MKYTIKCSCGHEIVVDVFGKEKFRPKALWFREDNECPSCFLLSLGKQGFAKKLPALAGSFKQIRWALQLREKHISVLKTAYVDSGKNSDYLILLMFVSKLTEAKDFIGAEMSSISLVGYYAKLYKDLCANIVKF